MVTVGTHGEVLIRRTEPDSGVLVDTLDESIQTSESESPHGLRQSRTNHAPVRLHVHVACVNTNI